MITDPLQRTRALYAWEREELARAPIPAWYAHQLDEARRLLGEGNAPGAGDYVTRVVERAWSRPEAWAWKRTWQRSPVVRVRRTWDGCSYCAGQTLLVFDPRDMHAWTILHEVAHARHGGAYTNPHSAGYVRALLRAASILFKLDQGDLDASAMMRGLL